MHILRSLIYFVYLFSWPVSQAIAVGSKYSLDINLGKLKTTKLNHVVVISLVSSNEIFSEFLKLCSSELMFMSMLFLKTRTNAVKYIIS